MIYEFVFFPFDLVLSLVAVLIVPGGFERDCLFIAARFLPPWAELADPSLVLFEKRGARAGDLSPWLDPRPLGWGALAVSEWVIKFYGLSRTADSEVHIVHISRGSVGREGRDLR